MCDFRKLTINDLDMVLRMNQNFREGFIDEDSVRRFLSDTRNWIYAAVLEGKVIGFAYGYELNRLDRKQNMLYIHEVQIEVRKYLLNCLKRCTCRRFNRCM